MGAKMRPKESRDSGQHDLLRSRLDQIIDTGHALAKLARTIDWNFLSQQLGTVYTDRPGRPPLPTRLMAGLAILKHMHDLSDEALSDRWLENPYYQYFCGEEFFRHKLPFDRSSITRWRQRMGEERLVALLQESLAAATRTGAAKPADFTRVIVDTTVQPKAIAHPTDAKLLFRAREHLVRHAKRHNVALRQSYERVGKIALIRHQRYAHAKQFKRANRSLKTLRTQITRQIGVNLMRIIADVGCRSHNAPKGQGLSVFTSGQKRGVNDKIKRELRRRSAVEPVIGHLKSGHRMDRNHLKGRTGDATNALLAAIGYNFRLLIAWITLLWASIQTVIHRNAKTQFV